MPTTQNISLTLGSAHNEDFTVVGGLSTDKLVFAAYKGGVCNAFKRSAEFNGSTSEIEITSATNYRVKLSAADIANISNSSSYTLRKVTTDASASGPTDDIIFSGTITVSGSSEVTPPSVLQVVQYSATEVVPIGTAAGAYTFQTVIPVGAKLEAVRAKGGNSTPDTGILQIGEEPITDPLTAFIDNTYTEANYLGGNDAFKLKDTSRTLICDFDAETAHENTFTFVYSQLL